MIFKIPHPLKNILLLYYALGFYVTLMVIFVYCNYSPVITSLIQHPITGHSGSARMSPNGMVFTNRPQWIPDCKCFRRYFYSPSIHERIRLNSSCSDEGTYYHLEQKIISYSLPYLGNDEETSDNFRGRILNNLRAMRTHYPGYTMRVYTNLSVVEDGYCDLVCRNTDLFWCKVQDTPCLGDLSNVFYTLWRVLPLGDDTVDVFLSRNLNSLLTLRDAAAVQDWLALPEQKPIQLMRDHELLHNKTILSGLWGAHNFYFASRQHAKRLRKSILYNDMAIDVNMSENSGFDDEVLRQAIYLKHPMDVVAYDSYHCVENARHTLVRPFPVQRKNTLNDFVGNTGLEIPKQNLTKCPVICRPNYGKNWKYC